MPRVVVVTDSTASLPAEVAQARGIRVVPLQVVIGARRAGRGSGRRDSRRGGRGAARLRAGQHVPAGARALRRALPLAGGRGRRGDRLGAPVGRDERHLRVRAARRARAGDAGARRRLRPGRHRDGLRSPHRLRRARRRRDGGGGGRGRAGPGRGGDVAVLRRHPGVPPPRRPDRCRRQDLRQRAVGEAPPRDRRRPRPAARARAYGLACPRPARRPRRRGCRRPAGRRLRLAPRQRRPRRRAGRGPDRAPRGRARGPRGDVRRARRGAGRPRRAGDGGRLRLPAARPTDSLSQILDPCRRSTARS